MKISKLSNYHDEKFSGLVSLFGDYRKFYGKEPLESEQSEFLKKRLVNGESLIYVAVIDGKLVGFAQIYFTFSSLSMKSAWVLNDLYVDKDYRREGVSRLLLEEIIMQAKKDGIAYISLQTAHDNLPAQSLYKRFGFQKSEYFESMDLTL